MSNVFKKLLPRVMFWGTMEPSPGETSKPMVCRSAWESMSSDNVVEQPNKEQAAGLKRVFSVFDEERAATTEESGTVLRSPRQNPTEAKLEGMTTEVHVDGISQITSLKFCQ